MIEQPCPVCTHPVDLLPRRNGDILLCAHCNSWLLVRFSGAGTAVLTPVADPSAPTSRDALVTELSALATAAEHIGETAIASALHTVIVAIGEGRQDQLAMLLTVWRAMPPSLPRGRRGRAP